MLLRLFRLVERNLITSIPIHNSFFTHSGCYEISLKTHETEHFLTEYKEELYKIMIKTDTYLTRKFKCLTGYPVRHEFCKRKKDTGSASYRLQFSLVSNGPVSQFINIWKRTTNFCVKYIKCLAAQAQLQYQLSL